MSLPELSEWAMQLRAKLRKFVKNKATAMKTIKERVIGAANSDSSDDEVEEDDVMESS